MLINYKDIKHKYIYNDYCHYVYIFKIYNLKNELININYLLRLYNKEFILDEIDYFELKQNNHIHYYYIYYILQINKKYVIFQKSDCIGKYKTNIKNGILKNNMLYSVDTFITENYIEFIVDKFKLSIKEYNKYKIQLQNLVNSQILLFNL